MVVSVGIVILAHRDLHRVAQLARALTQRGCRLVIHVDATTPQSEFEQLHAKLGTNRRISFATRVACEWGGFSLVQAGLSAAATLIDRWPEVSHVAQISGSCLPVRPINELSAFLAANEGVDFVESVPARKQGTSWVIDGLEMERFTLHFPFSFHTQRRLFDLAVKAQRRLGISRKIPQELEPHLGSQWWCLSRPTLEAILKDPKRPKFDSYFKSCWIPDEAYFPTLVRRHGTQVVSRSLTLSRFDDQGKPYIFYDDHEDILRQSDAFFARKIWSGADKLYRRFLSQRTLSGKNRLQTVTSDRQPERLEAAFQQARTRRCEAQEGRLNQGRFTRQTQTAVRYCALQGATHLYEDLPNWIAQATGQVTLGRLFKSNTVGTALPTANLPGGLPATPAFRDYNPEQYLANLIWNMREEPPILLHDISDTPAISTMIATDPNAQLTVLKGAWALDLFRRDLQDESVLKKYALRLMVQEAKQLEAIIRGKNPNARIVSVVTGLTHPGQVLAEAFGLQTILEVPNIRPIAGFTEFLERLDNLGINVSSVGDLQKLEAKPATPVALRVVSKSA